MRVRPGRAFFALVGGVFGVGVCIVLFHLPAWLFAVPLAPGLLGMAVDYRRLRTALDALTVTRGAPRRAWRELPFKVSLLLANQGVHDLWITAREGVPNDATPRYWITEVFLPAGTTMTLDETFRIPLRGPYRYGPAWVRIRRPYGMLEAQKEVPGQSRVKVLPEITAQHGGLARHAADSARFLQKLSEARSYGSATEFESLQEYRSGDDPRRMDWRATARQQRLIVRKLRIERCRDLIVVVDAGRLMGADTGAGTKLDCAVNGALVLCSVALRSQDRCGLGVFDDRVLHYLAPLSGSGSLRVILDCLYAVQSRWHESDFVPMYEVLTTLHGKRSLIVILSDLQDMETFEDSRAALVALSQRHEVIYAALRTPLLEAVTGSAMASTLAMNQTALAFRLRHERERALHAVQRAGIHVLDVDPRHLTAPLVKLYMDVRLRTVL